MMRVQNPQQRPRKQSVSPPLDFVCVDGRYRVGNLLGLGGSGKHNTDEVLKTLSELASECFFRERYQDRSQGRSEDRACRLAFDT